MSAEPIVQGTPAYRRLAAALLVAGFSTFALLYSVQPLLPLFAHVFHISPASSSLAISATTGTMALVFVPAGVLSDRVGRRPMMMASLFASGTATILCALAPGWHALLILRAIAGLALAGVPSVAMAYAAEEVAPKTVGSAMGIYIAGTALGGMIGRLGMTIVADLAGWQMAMVAMGAVGIVCAIVFAMLAPPSRSFVSIRHDPRTLIDATRRLFRDRALPWLYLEGFLLMGAFISIYNYTSFRLQAPPYSMTQTQVGFIFLCYIAGSVGSAWIGGLASRVGQHRIFWQTILAMIAGIALTYTASLPLIVLGLALMTGAFFGAHSTAASWVGRRVDRDRGQASALYLLGYYLGSSIIGALGGIAWGHAGWLGVVLFAGTLTTLGLLIAIRLIFVPLPHASDPPPLPPA